MSGVMDTGMAITLVSRIVSIVLGIAAALALARFIFPDEDR